jgi:hypothetical protein
MEGHTKRDRARVTIHLPRKEKVVLVVVVVGRTLETAEAEDLVFFELKSVFFVSWLHTIKCDQEEVCNQERSVTKKEEKFSTFSLGTSNSLTKTG